MIEPVGSVYCPMKKGLKYKCVLDHDSRHHRWLNSVCGYGNWALDNWTIYFKTYDEAMLFYITWIAA